MPELLDVLTNSAVYVIRARLAVIASELAANLIFTCSAPVGCQLRIAAANGDARDLSHGTTPSAAMAKEEELRTEVATIMLAIEDAETVYREHRWTRYFPCRNRDGHIHASLRGCSTVRWSTDMGWEPELSGKPVEDAVAKLGEALCTMCFPAAPSGWKAKTSARSKTSGPAQSARQPTLSATA
jgi:hypothetical protein